VKRYAEARIRPALAALVRQPVRLESRRRSSSGHDPIGSVGCSLITIFPLFEWVLGADHSDTKAARMAEAIPLLERTLADCERVRGADHPWTKAAREGCRG
jgi:hypothetical protein